MQSLEHMRSKLAQDEHLLSELEVILADYAVEHNRLVAEIGRLQTQIRDAEEHLAKGEFNDRRKT